MSVQERAAAIVAPLRDAMGTTRDAIGQKNGQIETVITGLVDTVKLRNAEIRDLKAQNLQLNSQVQELTPALAEAAAARDDFSGQLEAEREASRVLQGRIDEELVPQLEEAQAQVENLGPRLTEETRLKDDALHQVEDLTAQVHQKDQEKAQLLERATRAEDAARDQLALIAQLREQIEALRQGQVQIITGVQHMAQDVAQGALAALDPSILAQLKQRGSVQ